MPRCAHSSARTSISSLAVITLLLLSAQPSAAQTPSATPTVQAATHVSTSVPIRDMAVQPHIYRNPAPFVVPNRFPYRFDSQPIPEMRPDLVDPVLDAPTASRGFRAGQGTLLSGFEGTPVVNVAPPDPTGEIGPNHYVQMVNSRTTVYSRTGTILLGPVNNNTFWAGAGGLCEVNNDGDPIVLYDETADRWLISQFVSASGPDAMCVAISATPDPTGAYHRYEFGWPEGFPDYPKFGVWPTGYALTTSLFPDTGGSFSQAVMLERDQMLLGNAAQSIRFTLNDGTSSEYYSMLPADFNGPAPPAGTPALFAGLRLSSGTAANREVIRLYTLTPDWTTPANSTLTYFGGLPVAAFDVYALFSRSTAIPQLGTSDRVAGLGHRPMMQLQYRNFGGTGRLLFNHTVAVNDGPPTRTGVRWYELRDGGTGTWAIHQQGTYAPADGSFRWVGSMAMNDAGDIGLAYSVSSSAMHPAMRFTGQTAAESGSGVMDIPETEIFAGTGSQTGSSNRWGDYSHLSVDPADGSTFWYTNLYYQTTSSFNWRTRIASFSIAALGPPILAVAPSSLSASLDAGETDAQTLAIANTAAAGENALTWTAEESNGTTFAPTVSERTASGSGAARPSVRAGAVVPAQPLAPIATRGTSARPTAPSSTAARMPVDCTDGQTLEQLAATSAGGSVTGGQELGQSFTAPCSGVLTTVAPVINRTVGGNDATVWEATLRVYDGASTAAADEIAATAFSFDNATGPGTAFFLPIGVGPIPIIEGQVYTWFLDMTLNDTGAQFTDGSTGDVYPGGDLFFTADGNPANASALADLDMQFSATFDAPAVVDEVPWLSLSAASGTVAAGASENLGVTFDATGLADGTYTAEILLTSNDPARPTQTVPVTLIVGGNEATMVIASNGVNLFAPAQAGLTVDDLAALNLVRGIPGYAAGVPNLFTGYDGSAWTPPAGGAETLELGRAVRWFLRDGDRDFGSGSVLRPLPTVLTTATANTADVTLDLETDGDRFNMLGNPFGTPLDVSSVASWPGGTKVGNAFVWDNGTRSWRFAAEAAPWQAFFVKTRPGRTGTLTIPASAAVGSDAWAAADKTTETPGALRFELDGTALDGSPLADGALALVVGAVGDAKPAPLSTSYVAAGFADGDVLTAVEALRADGGSRELPIAVQTAGAERDLVLRWEAPTLPSSWRLTLTDTRTGATADLGRAGAYAFEHAGTPALDAAPDGVADLPADGAARFVLRIDTGDGALAKQDAELTLGAPFPNPAGEQARVPFALATAGAARLTVIDALGRRVATLADGDHEAGPHAATFQTRGLAAGMYVVRLEAGGQVMTQRVTVVR